MQFKRLRICLIGIPQLDVIAVRTSVQAMPVVVLRQLVFLPVQREFALRDTVSEATNQGTVIPVGSQIIPDIVVAQHHIRQLSIPVRHHQRYQPPSVIGNAGFCPVPVRQHIKSCLLTVRFCIKIRL
ncbi:hypothetical protein Barb6_03771 [Bacteroidales bacterium Barb6]|nr:hypothetical protein Barb6_03771 [Bacteroidales bacterium Barb6]